jgi:hypothetical protein
MDLTKEVIMWAVWNEIINIIFQNNRWHSWSQALKSHVRKAIDYKKLEWQYVLQQIQKNLHNGNRILKAFNKV